ncbi:HD domain-containing protein [Acidianus manzaensis]|uniref:HD domain-containing protein n=1 Tax=Acidianus manzaensis TaxID=282676 RepID=A0A1W6JWF3_9CREN|nr:HD domain-containing protein [Acidianus manzaensis]ARM74588.1 hypothetical protein B6F84_00120 [Acidianus manzaensis]
MAYIWMDPLTLSAIEKVEDSDRNKTVGVIQNIINKVFDGKQCNSDCAKFLNEVADGIVEAINKGWEEYFKSSLWGEKAGDEIYFVLIPADTRFPGFVNSLGDHMLTTSAFAVSAALAYYDLGCGELEAYGIKFDRELLRGFVRVAALLHDIGKPPVNGHAKRTEEIIKQLFSGKMPPNLVDALSKASSHHHYGRFYPEEVRPSNFIEWIVAFSDKASASSRSFLIKGKKDEFDNFVELALRIQNNKLYDLGGSDYLNSIRNRNSEGEEDDENLRTYGFLNNDEDKAIDLAKTLRKAENKLCGNKKLLSFYHFEIPSIKSYLKRGRELSVYAGYSIMIDSIIHRVSNEIKKRVGSEAVISDEGGSVLAIVPSSFDSSKIINCVLKNAPFEMIREGKMDFAFAEAHLGPEEIWRGWSGKDAYDRDSIRGFGSLLSKFFSEQETKIVCEPEKSDRLCEKCKMNPATEEGSCKLCKSAEDYYKTFYNAYRTLMGEGTEEELEGNEKYKDVKELRMYKLSKDLIDLLEKDNIRKPQIIGSLDNLNKDISGKDLEVDERRIPCLIVGDGDNFGSLKSNASTLTHYISITRRFTYMIYYSILYALENVAKDNYVMLESANALNRLPVIEFYPILLGGDDFSLIIPAQNVLRFSCYMDQALTTLNGRIEKGKMQIPQNLASMLTNKRPYEWFGISAGAYIYSNTSYPLFLAREKAEDLEHMSKRYSKNELQKRYNGSGFIVSILDDKYINAYEGGSKRGVTILGNEAKKVLDDIKELEESGISYRKILDYVKLKGDVLKIYYDVARNNGDSLKSVFHVISKTEEGGFNIYGYLILLSIMSKVLENRVNNKYYYELEGLE